MKTLSASLIILGLLFSCTTQTKVSSTSQSSSMTAQDNYYTHAFWRVKAGQTQSFLEAWERFGKALSQIPDLPAMEGTLIQSVNDSLVFYSFGAWESMEDIGKVRNDENAKKALAKIMAMCEEAKPGSYKKVLKLSYPSTRKE